MSGGSLDYICYVFNGTIDKIEINSSEFKDKELIRKFILHLRKVSKSLHDVEWYLSHDHSEKIAIKAIKRVLREKI